MKFYTPINYRNNLDITQTQVAIKLLKDNFEKKLSRNLRLTRVSAPLFVLSKSGLNDNLNGVEQPVDFTIKDIPSEKVEIVHSLAKWKRLALARYGLHTGQGLYTDMNAIRKDEELSNLHSIYVDQWDWELIIRSEDRNLDFLCTAVKKIYQVFLDTEGLLASHFPILPPQLPEEVKFISSQELEDIYPDLTPHQREREITKKFGAVFITQIGKNLKSGSPHDSRAPDYDDWELNGDLILWSHILELPMELSSMGIRVDTESLQSQLKASGKEYRLNLDFHRSLIEGELPLTIGGGIGQSRLCMYFLQKAHIGQVQSGLWDDETQRRCRELDIVLL